MPDKKQLQTDQQHAERRAARSSYTQELPDKEAKECTQVNSMLTYVLQAANQAKELPHKSATAHM